MKETVERDRAEHHRRYQQRHVVVRADLLATVDDQQVAPIEQVPQREQHADGDQQHCRGVAPSLPQAVDGERYDEERAEHPVGQRAHVLVKRLEPVEKRDIDQR